MDDASLDSVLSATKTGTVLEFARDPHPGINHYLVVEAPGDLLVLFPDDKRESSQVESIPNTPDAADPDRDAHLRRAFSVLRERVSPSVWTSSLHPYAELTSDFRRLVSQDPVQEDVLAYLLANTTVRSAAEMLFTSVAMSARADWRVAPESMRAVVARGWFLGRWVPTFRLLATSGG